MRMVQFIIFECTRYPKSFVCSTFSIVLLLWQEQRSNVMNDVNLYSKKVFEQIKHIDENGFEYWEAREL